MFTTVFHDDFRIVLTAPRLSANSAISDDPGRRLSNTATQKYPPSGYGPLHAVAGGPEAGFGFGHTSTLVLCKSTVFVSDILILASSSSGVLVQLKNLGVSVPVVDVGLDGGGAIGDGGEDASMAWRVRTEKKHSTRPLRTALERHVATENVNVNEHHPNRDATCMMTGPWPKSTRSGTILPSNNTKRVLQCEVAMRDELRCPCPGGCRAALVPQ